MVGPHMCMWKIYMNLSKSGMIFFFFPLVLVERNLAGVGALPVLQAGRADEDGWAGSGPSSLLLPHCRANCTMPCQACFHSGFSFSFFLVIFQQGLTCCVHANDMSNSFPDKSDRKQLFKRGTASNRN